MIFNSTSPQDTAPPPSPLSTTQHAQHRSSRISIACFNHDATLSPNNETIRFQKKKLFQFFIIFSDLFAIKKKKEAFYVWVKLKYLSVIYIDIRIYAYTCARERIFAIKNASERESIHFIVTDWRREAIGYYQALSLSLYLSISARIEMSPRAARVCNFCWANNLILLAAAAAVGDWNATEIFIYKCPIRRCATRALQTAGQSHFIIFIYERRFCEIAIFILLLLKATKVNFFLTLIAPRKVYNYYLQKIHFHIVILRSLERQKKENNNYYYKR